MRLLDDTLACDIRHASGGEELVLEGAGTHAYSEDALLDALATAPWRKKVRRVIVMESANVENCRFLKFLDLAETLIIESKRVTSVDGIASARKLRALIIRGKKSNRIDLNDLVRAKVA